MKKQSSKKNSSKLKKINKLKKLLTDKIMKAQKQGFPKSLQMCVFQNNKQITKIIAGKKYRYFDVAILTKVIVTVPAIIVLFKNEEIKLNHAIEKYLKFLTGSKIGKVTIKQLLTHSGGLVWWRPYFKELIKYPAIERRIILKKIIRAETRSSSKKCVYSDLDFILLGMLIEEIYQMPLDEVAEAYILKPLKLKNTFFNPKHPKLCAPTEKTKHRGLIQGVVHDDNAWSLGGVSGHAGLFSTLDDVGNFANYLGQSIKGNKISPVKLFIKRAVPKSQGDWALGFTVPSRPESTAGKLVSDQAFGHTGFVGTSIWVDYKRDLTVVILSNRTFPTHKDERFKTLRKELHDIVWKWHDEK